MTNAAASSRRVEWQEGGRIEEREQRAENGRRKWHNLKLRKCMRNKKGESAALAQGTQTKKREGRGGGGAGEGACTEGQTER